MSEHTNIKGRSLIQPPSGFIPSGMVPEEARWLIRMLELYFKGREIILKQISCSRLRRVADQESIELFFEDVGARGAEGLKACLRDVADGAKAEVKVRLHGIACMLDGALEPGLGPLSRAIRVPLGG